MFVFWFAHSCTVLILTPPYPGVDQPAQFYYGYPCSQKILNIECSILTMSYDPRVLGMPSVQDCEGPPSGYMIALSDGAHRRRYLVSINALRGKIWKSLLTDQGTWVKYGVYCRIRKCVYSYSWVGGGCPYPRKRLDPPRIESWIVWMDSSPIVMGSN